MKNSEWWQAYRAYRERVDTEDVRRAHLLNWFMVIITALLTAVTVWQCYEAHQQTNEMREQTKIQRTETPKPLPPPNTAAGRSAE